MVSGLTCRSLIHFEFIFVYGVRKWSSFILLQVAYPVFPTPFVDKIIFSHLYILPPLLKINPPYNHGIISELANLFH